VSGAATMSGAAAMARSRTAAWRREALMAA